ncbi:mutator mutT protein [Evansella caseinilytica]|uniref:Mutator mutT protein n=1 Tax=Evansella caseinilytica TaxID=1503961 RepID=A0A1H3SU70_9BACI|nr:NUDIX hydrolase [Evansella caseinilytica]SDZ41247.1 mutator mutT protein [Evansella caseinilytica]
MIGKHVITAGAVILNEEAQILLKKDPKRGWELPGGHVEQGETIKAAVIREVKEETGIDIEVIKFCGVSEEVNQNICNMWWLGKPAGGELQTSQESLEVGFFAVNKALQLIENDVFQKELLACLTEEKHPFYLSF